MWRHSPTSLIPKPRYPFVTLSTTQIPKMPYLPDFLRFSSSADMKTWIVVFKPHTSIEEISAYVHEVEKAGGRVLHTYYNNFKGFSATMSDNFVKALQSARSDIIEYIEEDQEIHIMPYDA